MVILNSMPGSQSIPPPDSPLQPSFLLEKGRRLGLAHPEDYERLAVLRGCLYYDVQNRTSVVREESGVRVSRGEFSNAELAIALLSPHLPKTLLRQRMGAAMLSASDVDPADLIELAQREGCTRILRHIAKCGAEVEPDNGFWTALLHETTGSEEPDHDMPHPTRFIEMTGLDRVGIGIRRHWIRPVESLASAP